jgi:hypothetical protein
MPGKRTRIALFVHVRDEDTDPEAVAREIYEQALKPFVAERYEGRVLAVPVGEFHDMPGERGDTDGEQ